MEEPALTPRTGIGLLRPLRHRDFRLLWIGQTVSMIGDGTYVVAIAWLVYKDLNGTPADFAAVGVAWSLPQVLLVLAAGTLSDRVDRRRVMIAGDLLRLLAITAIGTLALSGAATISVIVGLVAVYGAGMALFQPAFNSIVPNIVPKDILVEANSVAQVVRPLAMLAIGPLLGGLLLALGTGWAFLFDGVTFAVSALCVAAMRVRPNKDWEESEPFMHQVRDGLRYVRTQTWIVVSLVIAAVSLFCVWGPYETLVPVVVTIQLHGSGLALALVFAAGGLGSVLVGLVMAQRGGLPRKPVTVMYLVWALGMLMTAGFGIVTAVWQAMIVSFVAESSIALLIVIWYTALQRIVPDEFLGRVMSLDWMITIAGLPLSFAVVGPVAQWLGVDRTLVIAGVLGAAVTIAGMYVPGARAPERDGRLGSSRSEVPVSPGPSVSTGPFSS